MNHKSESIAPELYRDYGYYDAGPMWNHHYTVAPIKKMLLEANVKTVLDVGCGNGAFVNELLECGYDAYGVDASVTGVALASSVNPGHFFVMDVERNRLPEELADVDFDCVVSMELIEHLYDPRRHLKLVRNVLSKTERTQKAQLLITTPYHGYLKNLSLAVLGHFDRHFAPLWDGGHIKFWSRSTLGTLLSESGFDVQEFKGCGRAPLLWKSMLLRAQLKCPGASQFNPESR